MGKAAATVAGWMGRRYPFYSGCGTIAQNALLRHLAGEGEAWVRLRNGCRICVPLSDFDGRAIYYFGDVDPKVTWLCKSLLRPGDVAVDIGANLGMISLTMGKCVGPTGTVTSFEPSPRTADYLQRSLLANPELNITLHRCAVSDRNGHAVLNVPHGHSGMASIVRSDVLLGESVEVPMVRASDALEGLQRIRMMKIDVEGYEPIVLDGMRDRLLDDPPQFVLFECHTDNGSVAAHESVRTLSSTGYEIHWIQRSIRRPQVRLLSSGITGIRSGDLLAVHRSALDDPSIRNLRA